MRGKTWVLLIAVISLIATGVLWRTGAPSQARPNWMAQLSEAPIHIALLGGETMAEGPGLAFETVRVGQSLEGFDALWIDQQVGIDSAVYDQSAWLQAALQEGKVILFIGQVVPTEVLGQLGINHPESLQPIETNSPPVATYLWQPAGGAVKGGTISATPGASTAVVLEALIEQTLSHLPSRR